MSFKLKKSVNNKIHTKILLTYFSVHYIILFSEKSMFIYLRSLLLKCERLTAFHI